MIVARPHQEGTLKVKIRPTGVLKVRLYTSPIRIVPKINIFHPEIDPDDIYDGDYIVKPIPYDSQELQTREKYMENNVVVLAIPYFETSNISNGLTVYIGD